MSGRLRSLLDRVGCIKIRFYIFNKKKNIHTLIIIKASFFIKKYPVNIQTRTTQIVNSKLNFEKELFARFLKIIGV